LPTGQEFANIRSDWEYLDNPEIVILFTLFEDITGYWVGDNPYYDQNGIDYGAHFAGSGFVLRHT